MVYIINIHFTKHIPTNKDLTMKLNWPMIGIMLTGILFWTSVYFNGLFLSITCLMIISAIIGLWLRLSGRA